MSENSIIKKDNTQVRKVLQTSLYPGAADESVDMVLAYCEVAKLDVMQKPVHIVPMWDSKAKAMKDVIMPGIGLYRIQAARTGQYMGMSEPEHGPDITENIGGVTITFPLWTKVTVKRLMDSGLIAEFSAKEYWKENYAVKGGQEKSIAPNAMWTKRPYGQNAKCAEAQALRKAFPELGSAPTADEMEGKEMINVTPDATVQVQSGTLATAEELKARAAQRAQQQQKDEPVIIEQAVNEGDNQGNGIDETDYTRSITADEAKELIKIFSEDGKDIKQYLVDLSVETGKAIKDLKGITFGQYKEAKAALGRA